MLEVATPVLFENMVWDLKFFGAESVYRYLTYEPSLGIGRLKVS